MTTTSVSHRAATRLALAVLLLGAPACGHSRATTTRTAMAPATAPPDTVQPEYYTQQHVYPTASEHAPTTRRNVPPAITDPMIDQRVAELRTRLSLDPQQEAEVRRILLESRGRYDVLRQQAEASGGMQDPALREQFVQLHFDTEDRIYGSLRCEQKDELRVVEREERAARIEQYRARRRGRGGEGTATTTTQEIP